MIDFDNGGNQDGGFHTEPGYQSYVANHEVPADFTTQSFDVTFNITGGATVSITPAWPNTTDARVQQMIDRGSGNDTLWLGNNINLITDWLGTDTRTANGGNGDYNGTTGVPTYMTLTLSGVPEGVYDWISLHHDTEHMNTDFIVELSTDGGATYGEIGRYRMTDTTPGGNPDSLNPIDGSLDPDPFNLPSTVHFQITSTGDDIVLRFAPLSQVAVHQQLWGINGFVLTQLVGPTSTIALGLNFGADEYPDSPNAGTLATEAEAGVEIQSHWNNLSGAAGSASDLVADSAGTVTPTSVSVTWSSPNTWSSTGRGEENNGFPVGSGDFVLMTGYLDTTDADAGVATVTVSGLGTDFTANGYDVIVYSLGGVAGRGGGYTIGGTTKLGTAPASPTEHVKDLGADHMDTGTYTRFTGLTDSSFTLVANANATLGFGSTRRAPINAIQIVSTLSTPSTAYEEPQGGWAYKYDAEAAAAGTGGFTALDGTWSHDNGSDEWDGSAFGSGSPGGVTLLSDGSDSYIRIQETGDPRSLGFPDPGSNRKIYLGHDISADGFAGPILADGFTLSFRAKIATGAPLDDQYSTAISPWPVEGKGYLGHDGGKGNISVRQGDFGVVSFSLSQPPDTAASGLNMNGLNGSAASGTVDPFQNEGTANFFPVEKLNEEWHEFWVNIIADASGGGSHRVDLYADGAETPTTFHVTAGNGSDFAGVNYLAIGAGATPQQGAWDLDFVAYKPGIHLPKRAVLGNPIRFEQQPVSLTVNEGDSATFTTVVSGTPPRQLQWQKNGVDIEGETKAELVISRTDYERDNGAVFTLVASNPFGTKVSDSATLTVIEDVTGPHIVSAASADPLYVGVRFDDYLDPNTAEDPFNWIVNGEFGVEAVTVRADEKTVILKMLEGSEVGAEFTVEPSGLFDIFGNEMEFGQSVTGKRWMDGVADVGAPEPAGEHFTAEEGVIEVTAGGADIWGASDQGTFAYQVRSGNFDVKVRIDDVPLINANSKGGINIRPSLEANSPMLWFNPTPPRGANTIQYGLRSTAGASVTDVGQPRPSVDEFPVWLRMRRVGNSYTAFYSRDGDAWTQVGVPQDLTSFGDPVYLCLATTSHAQGTPALVKYADFGEVDLSGATIMVSGPDDQTVINNRSATFAVTATVTGASPDDLAYQWEIETAPNSGVFTAIPGANLPSYTTPPRVLSQHNGLHYRCVVSVGVANPTPSRSALLTVLADNVPPALVSARGDISFTKVILEYDEVVNGATAADPFNYSLKDAGGNEVTINSGELDASGRIVTLTTDPQASDTTYTVTATGITDISDNEAAELTITYRSFVISRGFARRDFYFGIGGVLISDLVNAPNYPNFPSQSDYSPRLEGVVDTYDNYGIRISGFLVPQESGAYDFYMSSDDAGDFMLSTDASPANLQLIAQEPQWNGSRDWLGTARRNAAAPENRSTTLFPDGVQMEAGQRYYFEARMKEGGGGDNLAVAVAKHGEALSASATPISGAFALATAADPVGASVHIAQQPQDVVIDVACEDGGGPIGPSGLFIDFDNAGNQDAGPHTELGYQSYAANHEVAADFVAKSYSVNFAYTGPATVSIQPTWPNTTDARVQQMIDRGAGNDANWLGNNLDLLTDWLGTDTRTGNGGNGNYDGVTGTPTYLDLTLSGLPAGSYHWVSFHHDTENMHTPFTVAVSDDGGANFVEVGQFQMTDSTPGGTPDSMNPINGSLDPDPHHLTSTVQFVLPSSGANVVIRFTPLAQVAVHQQFFGINGFELTQLEPMAPPTPKILLVSDNIYSNSRAGTGDPEVGMVSLLEGLGYEVIRATGEGASAQFTEGQQGGAGAAAVGADLIIVSGVANSGNYDADITSWNNITTPILLLSPHISRNNRWQWFNTATIVDDAQTSFVYPDPNHPFVKGLGTDFFSAPTPLTRIGINNAGNGTVIATDAAGNVTLAEWQAGVAYYAGGPVAAGRRVAMARHRYHEDDPSGNPIQWGALSANGKAILARVVTELAPLPNTGGNGYQEPTGGWAYKYDGSAIEGLGACKPSQVLDNTWSANNGSSEFDGSLRGPGNGMPGGISTKDGVLTIEDINMGSGSCNNRKIFFTHDLAQDIDNGVASSILDNGVTISFRARLTQPDIDPPAELTAPDGWGIFSGGKGNFCVRQSNPSAMVSFSLVRQSEPDNNLNFPSAGLTMNRLNGDSPLNNEVNSSGTSSDNQVLALDPNEFHEYWITIKANDGTAGNGTHTVSIYVDGSTTPAVFNVTAGTGNEGAGLNMIAMGLNNSGGAGAIDVDFFAYKEGVHAPTTGGGTTPPPGGGNSVTFSVAATGQITGNDNPPLFVQWQKDGQDIPGANDLTYTAQVSEADSGAQFRALIAVPGAEVYSDAATVLFNQPPQVSIVDPAEGQTFVIGSTVTVVAQAMDVDGSVSRVEFFAEGVGSLGSDTDGSDGWSVSVPNVPAGIFILSAVATDNLGNSCSSMPVMIEVLDNQPPVCESASASTLEDTPVDIPLPASDPDGDVLVYSITTGPANGMVTVNGNMARYVPAPNYFGSDQFGFKVTDPAGESSECSVMVVVMAVNDAPVCSDSVASTDEDTPVTITLDASDVDSENLTFTIVSNPANGAAVIEGNKATYTPALNYNGSDSFTFKVSDGELESGVCAVTITINPVNDAPVAVIDVSPLSDLGPTVPGLIVISPDNESACVTLDGSRSSDVDNPVSDLTYLWVVDDEVMGTDLAIHPCLSVGSHTVKLIVDDGEAEYNLGETTVVVEILSAAEAIDELIMVVNDSVVERKNKQPFLATLKTAAASFERGNFQAGLNRLVNAFQNKVNAQIGKDNPDVAEEWIRIAQEIVDALNRSEP